MDTSSLLTLQSADFSRSEAAQARATAAAKQKPAATAVAGTAQPTAATSRQNAKLGQDFESMCLSQMLAPMFEGLSTDGPFGGGEGEQAMRSFYLDAMAKEMAKRGGVGISNMMQKELLKLQGAA